MAVSAHQPTCGTLSRAVELEIGATELLAFNLDEKERYSCAIVLSIQYRQTSTGPI
jgi:hypothetical protein